MNTRKTSHREKPWVKKNGEEDFDVPMGCHNGAEICELVGTFIVKISRIMQEQSNVGLYRDDGFGIFRNLFQPNTEKKKKNRSLKYLRVIYHCNN